MAPVVDKLMVWTYHENKRTHVGEYNRYDCWNMDGLMEAGNVMSKNDLVTGQNDDYAMILNLIETFFFIFGVDTTLKQK